MYRSIGIIVVIHFVYITYNIGYHAVFLNMFLVSIQSILFEFFAELHCSISLWFEIVLTSEASIIPSIIINNSIFIVLSFHCEIIKYYL